MTNDEIIIECLCRDLNAAHDEIVRMHHPEIDASKQDWPEWSGPANSIRAAEKLLGKKLAKTNLWTLFPEHPTAKENI